MTSIRFHESAAAELIAQAQFYEEKSPGLGDRFLVSVQAAIAIVRRFPLSGSPYLYGTRRILPQTFRISIVYLHFDDGIVVLAIAPHAKREGYWSNRVSDDR